MTDTSDENIFSKTWSNILKKMEKIAMNVTKYNENGIVVYTLGIEKLLRNTDTSYFMSSS